MYDMGLDVINDPDIDQLLDRAIELYFDQHRKYILDDLVYLLNTGYRYPSGPGGFQLYLEGDPNFDGEKYEGGHADRPALHIDMIKSVMEKVAMLIGVKIMNLNYYNPNQSINISLTRDFIDPDTLKLTKQLSPEERQGLEDKLRKAAELFKRRSAENNIPAVTQHVYDKMMKPMYEIYNTVIRRGDFIMKENKIKITRRQLRRMITESMYSDDPSISFKSGIRA